MDKTTLEQNCYTILALLMWNPGLHRNVISSHLRMDFYECARACNVLVDRDLVICVHGVYTITGAGREAYGGARKKVYFNLGSEVRRFKEEALTGVREEKCKKSGYKITEPSCLENVAIPSDGRPVTEASDADRDFVLDARRQLCSALSITEKQLDKAMSEHRVRICKGYNNLDHIGIFDKAGLGKWAPLCRICMKMRKKK